jgi:hypothetical protein
MLRKTLAILISAAFALSVLETRVLPVAKTALGVRDTPVPPEKIILEKVTVNPKLDDAHFSRPQVGVASKTK